jgi:NAD(P)-dependent dehydrogenase (short-subunit alcohol dehydrogenase family)
VSDQSVAIVTGGGSGIGAVIAQSLLREGYVVHVCDSNQRVLDELQRDEPAIGTTVADVGDHTAVDRLFDDVEERYGRLDVLVNNAGIAGPTAAVEDINPLDWSRTVAVDLNGAFYCARRAIPLLKTGGGGSIINIASNAAFFGFPLRGPYTACKWALIGLTKTLAMELGPAGIRVNAICPGSVKGPRIDGVIERDAKERGLRSDEIRKIYARQSSMRLFVDAADVAALAVFLASSAAATISGQAIGVDGHTESLSNWLDD